MPTWASLRWPACAPPPNLIKWAVNVLVLPHSARPTCGGTCVAPAHAVDACAVLSYSHPRPYVRQVQHHGRQDTCSFLRPSVRHTGPHYCTARVNSFARTCTAGTTSWVARSPSSSTPYQPSPGGAGPSTDTCRWAGMVEQGVAARGHSDCRRLLGHGSWGVGCRQDGRDRTGGGRPADGPKGRW